MTDELHEVIKQAIHRIATELQNSRENEIHVTDLTTCIRRSYYMKKHGFPMDENMAFWLLFGHIVHRIVAPEIAKALDGDVEVEKVFEWDGVEIHATADILTDKYVIELKTCNRIPQHPYESHLEQVNAYMHIFDKPIAKIVYISRSQLETKVFTYYGDWQLFIYTMQKATVLHKHLQLNTPPPCNLPPSDRKFYCKNCPFLSKCQEDANATGLDNKW